MKTDFKNYTLFFKFIETFAPVGFQGTDPDHPIMKQVEYMMENNDQFLIVADIIGSKYMFASKRSKQLVGIEPTDLNPYHLIEVTHPDDIHRHCQIRAKLISLAGDLYSAGKGSTVYTTSLSLRNPTGGYSDILFQGYLFYSEVPYKSIYILQIHTNINRFRKAKTNFHYYVGNDLSHFKYPDEEMLHSRNILTRRELEITKLIGTGLCTDEIAEKLFLSPHTVNTHRGNILKKTNKPNMPELIYELLGSGLL
jgi:DNA-binding CsgD family transcriptional regulator